METLEIVKTCRVELPKDDGHKKRVQDFLGTGPDIWERQILNRFKGAGFHLFVKKGEVEDKFKYKAGINGSYREQFCNRAVIFPVVTLMAVFPFIVNYILHGGWAWFLCLPLYVLTSNILMSFGWGSKSIDYVGDVPDFALENVKRYEKVSSHVLNKFTIHSMSPLPTEEHMVKVDPVLIGWPTDDIGVVIAIWDGEKEIEVL